MVDGSIIRRFLAADDRILLEISSPLQKEGCFYRRVANVVDWKEI